MIINGSKPNQLETFVAKIVFIMIPPIADLIRLNPIMLDHCGYLVPNTRLLRFSFNR